MNRNDKLEELEGKQRALADEIKALREQPDELEIDWSKMIGVPVVRADIKLSLESDDECRTLSSYVDVGDEYPFKCGAGWRFAKLPNTQHLGLRPFKGDKMPDELDDEGMVIVTYRKDAGYERDFMAPKAKGVHWWMVTHYAKVSLHRG